MIDVLVQASGESYPEPIQNLFTDLLHVVGPGQMHWRYSLRADALLLFLLPPTDAQSASLLTQHYLRLVLSQLLSQRSLGLTGLLYLLRQGDDWATVSLSLLMPSFFSVLRSWQSRDATCTNHRRCCVMQS